MTTVAAPRAESSARVEDRFYFYMAVACAAVAFLGFAPTYWVPMASGKLAAPPVIHLHGAVFFLWSLFLVWQVSLATSGQIRRHRTMGLIAISLATAMVIFGAMAAIRSMQSGVAAGMAHAGESFAIVPLAGIAYFMVVFALGIVNVRRTEWHKRLMLLSAISILDAPVARWFIVFLAPPGAVGPPPVAVTIMPALTAYLLILAAAVFDWRTRGRPHEIYVVGGLALVALKLLTVPLSETAGWHAVARALLAFTA